MWLREFLFVQNVLNWGEKKQAVNTTTFDCKLILMFSNATSGHLHKEKHTAGDRKEEKLPSHSIGQLNDQSEEGNK